MLSLVKLSNGIRRLIRSSRRITYRSGDIFYPAINQLFMNNEMKHWVIVKDDGRSIIGYPFRDASTAREMCPKGYHVEENKNVVPWRM